MACHRRASHNMKKHRYSFEVNRKKLILRPFTPSQIYEDEKTVKENMEKYEREKNEKSKGVHVDIPREEKGEVVLSEESGMSRQEKSELEGKEKRQCNEITKVYEVEREKQEGLSEEKEKNISEIKEAKGEERVSLVIKAKESPRVERPSKRRDEPQEMVGKDTIGFQHELGEINSCWMVEDKSLVYDMELPKSIAKLEPLHKIIQGDDIPLVNKSKYSMYNWFIRILGLSRTHKVFLEVMNYTLISYIGDFIIFVDDDILMHIKSLTIISKFNRKSEFLPFEIEYDIDDYAFQLGEKRLESYEKMIANELNISSSLIQVSNEFSLMNC
ncbi:uncharacterized protein [Nicotiana tomentosiformis]|uniref:uncharacterized protein n=1 Tax=Nicotiana tomentosiformis TaxID=4098 RepID=UPI00388C502F